MIYKKQSRRKFLTTSALVSVGLVMAGPKFAFSAEPTQKESILTQFAHLLASQPTIALDDQRHGDLRRRDGRYIGGGCRLGIDDVGLHDASHAGQ